MTLGKLGAQGGFEPPSSLQGPAYETGELSRYSTAHNYILCLALLFLYQGNAQDLQLILFITGLKINKNSQ